MSTEPDGDTTVATSVEIEGPLGADKPERAVAKVMEFDNDAFHYDAGELSSTCVGGDEGCSQTSCSLPPCQLGSQIAIPAGDTRHSPGYSIVYSAVWLHGERDTLSPSHFAHGRRVARPIG